ncbi:hypothetical protein MET9862_05481 [Methylobacterium symbioticum]|uniref:Uncharacterized protein n=1 Tax=Methylobacterium symbioticum TaxID=2584084 RepID=A0A509EL26_9HYPH|nr:hypothetical protein MET9862_05481 [Methylobacterium symbioticum]
MERHAQALMRPERPLCRAVDQRLALAELDRAALGPRHRPHGARNQGGEHARLVGARRRHRLLRLGEDGGPARRLLPLDEDGLALAQRRAQFQEAHHLPGEAAQRVGLGLGEATGAGLGVEDA